MNAAGLEPHARIHGGTDALGVPRFDFSTNSNACGPCPQAHSAVQQAVATHYPDAGYSALRAQLAEFHGVAPQRLLLAGSASEFIFRITAWAAQQGARAVSLPAHSYGDYAAAARAWGLACGVPSEPAQLIWACEPSSPQGGAYGPWPAALRDADQPLAVPLVLDCAYAPLRLSGAPSLSPAQRARVWQLWSPNKALGLTGVRAAYAIAPLQAEAAVAALERLCPSWPLGAHGVAMLQAWVQPEVQRWLADSLQQLSEWKLRQIGLLQALGWTCHPSDSNFFCARPDQAPDPARLRAAGIKLRDARSFGLPGQLRLSVQPPAAQDALEFALQRGGDHEALFMASLDAVIDAKTR